MRENRAKKLDASAEATISATHMSHRRPALALFTGIAVAGSLVFGFAKHAWAKVTFDSPYTFEQTYNAALRLVRVDLGLKITERDPDAAYLLFDYKSAETGSRVVPGSIEFVRTDDAVRVVVQLSQMPRYHEQVMADALAKKLQHDFGDPPKRKAPPPEPPADGGTDAPAE